MNEESKLLLFMPIVVASYTNAVYTCQLMNPDMKNNPEAAIAHVLLTSQRIDEILRKTIAQSTKTDLNIGHFLLSEIQELQQKMEKLSSLPSPTEQEQKEKIMIEGQTKLLLKISEFLKSAY